MSELPKPMRRDWLSHADALDYLGVSRQTMYRYRREGLVVAKQHAGRLIFKRASLERLLKNLAPA